MAQGRRRATTLIEWEAIEARLFPKPPESFKLPALRPDDVVITPFAKSGTTWLQQIFHQLRTGGDMDFDDISRVVPWLETAYLLNFDLNAPQRAKPRGFKSHLPYTAIPKDGRYINSVRHPADAAYSMFKFMEGWFIEPGTITADEVAHKRFIQSNGYFEHLISWWQQKDDSNVLFMAYEHMLADPPGTIARVAAFCDIPLSDDLLTLVLERSSISYMSEHKDRFDDAMFREMSEREVLPTGSDSAKVRRGQRGEHIEGLSQSLLEQLDQKWQDTVGRELGFRNYETLLDAL